MNDEQYCELLSLMSMIIRKVEVSVKSYARGCRR
jgi:hypothetical protein